MKKILFYVLGFVVIGLNSCRKDSLNSPVFLSTVIDFDQCHVSPADSSSNGYIIII